MIRSASAQWQGKLADGCGRLTTTSGVLVDTPYSFATRFEGEAGTNPEELVAAAHAGCFSMALAFFLEKKGRPAENISTNAELSLKVDKAGWQIAGIHFTVAARVPHIGDTEFRTIAEEAKRNCLISRLLNTPITLDAQLVNEIRIK